MKGISMVIDALLSFNELIWHTAFKHAFVRKFETTYLIMTLQHGYDDYQS